MFYLEAILKIFEFITDDINLKLSICMVRQIRSKLQFFALFLLKKN